MAKKTEKNNPNQVDARFIALFGVRNSLLEDLHSGEFPRSKKKDFSDVVVVTPYGKIPWNHLSRISEKEMRKLMLEVEKNIQRALWVLSELKVMYKSEKKLEKAMKEFLFEQGFVSWDRPKHMLPKKLKKSVIKSNTHA